jgi:hypothetical protein
LIYRHEQVGRVYVAILGFVAVVCAAFAIVNALQPPYFAAGFATMLWASIAFIFVALTCIAFARLSIEVAPEGVRWWMTFSFPGGFIPMEEIVSVDIIPVSFWYGIGVHFTLRGWVWNVALGRGVQIHRCGGMPIVLGTDQPEALVAAISRGRSG